MSSCINKIMISSHTEKLFIVKFSIIVFILTKINRKRGYNVIFLEITILNIKLWSY